MSDQIKLNHIPKLSDDLSQIRVTYDRKNIGIRVELVKFRAGDEKLLLAIMDEVKAMFGNEQFVNMMVTKMFQDALKKNQIKHEEE